MRGDRQRTARASTELLAQRNPGKEKRLRAFVHPAQKGERCSSSLGSCVFMATVWLIPGWLQSLGLQRLMTGIAVPRCFSFSESSRAARPSALSTRTALVGNEAPDLGLRKRKAARPQGSALLEKSSALFRLFQCLIRNCKQTLPSSAARC